MTTNKRNVWWLCSWFPDKMQAQNGDFIERHALATSAFANIDVFHVAPATTSVLGNKPWEKTIERKNENLQIYTVLYAKKNDRVSNKLRSVFQYFRQYKRLLKSHIDQKELPDIVHVHIAFKDGIMALWLKRKYNIPYVVSEHWSLYHKENGKAYKRKSFIFKFIVQRVLRNASLVLPVSDHLGKALQQIVPTLSYQVIPNVVNTDFFFLEKEKKDAPFTFLHVSTMDANKNPQGILYAFAVVRQKHPKAQLVLIGNIENLRFDQLPENVSLIPTIPNEEVAHYLKRSHAFVLFSYAEGQPCVLLESLCCGIPVVSSAVGGVPEIICKENGLLVQSGDVQALSEKMLFILEHYDQFKPQNISEKAIRKYCFEEVGKKIADIYENIFSQK